ncbi:MAG: 2-amino-4-hydroxy-6-hydroxymethyldihydropteridine diphosphokinase [Gammaproteobacteria bacterium]|nr:2-amino-4-hydroxy-6-hydroxymethyldihydropteridine diphosphokinase [Gammaproteobacteria bacterium]
MTTDILLWRPAYVGLGSNLNGPAKQIDAAFDLLDTLPGSRLVARSSLYRSAPFGGVEQPEFVNAVAAMLTQLDAITLLQHLKEIERKRGRERGEARWGPRVIDLDLLVYSGEVIDQPEFTLPHPGIAERNFVLLPLRELAPDLDIPGLGRVATISVNEQEPRIERIA